MIHIRKCTYIMYAHPPHSHASSQAPSAGGSRSGSNGAGGAGGAKRLYKAPTDNRKPQQTIESLDRLYKAPERLYKAPERL